MSKRKREEAAVTWQARLDAFDTHQACIEYYADQLDDCLHDTYLIQLLIDLRVPVETLHAAMQAGATYDTLYLHSIGLSLLEYAARSYIPHFTLLAIEIGRPYIHDPVFGYYVVYVRKLAHQQQLHTDRFIQHILSELKVTVEEPTQLPFDLDSKSTVAEWLRPYKNQSMFLHLTMFIRMLTDDKYIESLMLII
jgi:hypothetical protein